jgi:microcystin-dependent protein
MPAGTSIYNNTTAAPINMSPSALGNAGSNMAHANLMPYLCVNFIIAMAGIYPTQS